MPISWPSQPRDDVSEIDSDSSMPSYPSSDASYDEDQAALIQEEWEESMRQIEAVLSVILLPFFGKWYGRRFAFWGGLGDLCKLTPAWDRYQAFGWSRSLFNLAVSSS